MKYTVVRNVGLGTDTIRNNETFSFFSVDENNKDYKEYLEWVAEGNTATIEEL